MPNCKNSNCKKDFQIPAWALEPIYADYCEECIHQALKKNLRDKKSVEDVVNEELKRSFVTPRSKEEAKIVYSFSYTTADGKPKAELYSSIEKMYSQVYLLGQIISENFLHIRTLEIFNSKMRTENKWKAEIIGDAIGGWVQFEKHKVIFKESKLLTK